MGQEGKDDREALVLILVRFWGGRGLVFFLDDGDDSSRQGKESHNMLRFWIKRIENAREVCLFRQDKGTPVV